MWPSSKGEKRPADVINAAIIGKQRRHPDNSWEERVSPMTHESGARSGKWTADVRDGSIASFWSSADYFRSSPGDGHRQGRSPCLKGAKSRRSSDSEGWPPRTAQCIGSIGA